MPYADVHGLHLYYDEHGEGPPLVLIHGGLLTVEIAGIDVPVLVLVGDTDFILVPNAANAAEAADLLPQGQLAVLPGTTHMGVSRSGLVPGVVDSFLLG